jgi:hypothetical protein
VAGLLIGILAVETEANIGLANHLVEELLGEHREHVADPELTTVVLVHHTLVDLSALVATHKTDEVVRRCDLRANVE